MSDAMEAGGQNVDQEAADELIRRQAHDLHAVTALDAVVFPPEGDSVGIGADEAMVGDRHTVRVSAQIRQDRLGSTEGWLCIHNPFDFAQRCEMDGKSIRVCQSHQIAKELELASSRKLAIPSRNRRRNNLDKTFTGRKNPERHATHFVLFGDSPPPGTMTLYMRVVCHCRAPCVEQRCHADLCAEVFGIGRDGQKRLRGCLEQQAIDRRLVLIGDIGDLRWRGEDHMEVLDR